jgi:hypothetical protein
VDPKEFQRYFERHGRFTAGMGTQYKPSIICGPSDSQELAQGFLIGTRFHSSQVVRLSDARPVQLGHLGKADGRWRLYAFAGTNNSVDAQTGIFGLCKFLDASPQSPVRKFTPLGQDVDAIFDLRAIFQKSHRDLDVESLPALLVPKKGRYGLQDYEKVFCADADEGNDIFKLRGVDRNKGALVVVRPDQYIAHVLPLDAYDDLTNFFGEFMLSN